MMATAKQLKIRDKELNKIDLMSKQDITLGGIALKETIGHGSFGKVKAGLFSKTGEKVAVKMLNRKKMKSMEVVGKVRREIIHLQKFQHPHIIRLYKVISTPTEIFMIMEFAAGGELFEYIVKEGRLRESEARRFFQQLISGVDYLHRNMVVHRDLKPENLLLDDKMRVKIADFGLSNIMSDGDFLGTSCGSPNYAAPEVIAASLYAGPEVDLWSCGVILYAFLCGALPFDDDHIPTLFKKIKAGVFKIPSFLCPDVAALLQGLMTVNPTKRMTVQSVVDNPWFQKELPAYLFPPIYDHQTSIVDSESVKIVAKKFGSDISDVADALINGDPHNPMKIAYQILVDNKRYPEKPSFSLHPTSGSPTGLKYGEKIKVDMRCVNACLAPGQRFCRSDCDLCPKWGAKECVFARFVPSLAKCDTCVKYGRPGCIFALDKQKKIEDVESADLTKGRPHRHPERIRRPNGLSHTLVYQDQDGEEDSALTVQPGRPKSGAVAHRLKTTKAAKWHLGIRSNCNPIDIMREIYKIMKGLNFEWQIINPYHLIVQQKDGDPNSPKIRLQLYQADNHGSYLLDFKSLVDEQMGSSAASVGSRVSRSTPGVSDEDATTSSVSLDSELATDIASFTINESREPLDLVEELRVKSQTMQFFDMCAALIQALART